MRTHDKHPVIIEAIAKATQALALCSLALSLRADPPGFLDGSAVALQIGVGAKGIETLQQAPTNYVQATMQYGGGQALQSQLCLHAGSRISDEKPDFILVAEGATVRLTRAVRPADPLGGFLGSELARAMDVCVPASGPVVLRFNGRYLGVYAAAQVLDDRVAGYCLPNCSGLLLPCGRPGKPPNLDPAAEAVLARLKEACREPDHAARLRALDAVADVDRLCRFLAWESFLGYVDGYAYSGTGTSMLIDTQAQRVYFLAANAPAPFSDPKFVALATMQGPAAAALVETGEGRSRMLAALADIAMNPELQTYLTNVLQQCSSSVAAQLAGLKEIQWFERGVASLQQQMAARFESVRSQVEKLAAKSDRELASVRLPVVQVYRRTQEPLPLPESALTNKILVVFDEALRRSEGPDAVEGPKMYDLAITAPAGLLEELPVTSTNWVDVTVACQGASLPNTALRLRGHGTRQSFRGKPSFTLKFNARTMGQTLDGLTKIHVHNAVYDPSFLNQYIGWWLFSRAGLPAPQVGFARLSVNGKPFGLFVTVEGVNRHFLKRHFTDGGGLLFEGEFQDIDEHPHLDSGILPDGYQDLESLKAATEAARSANSIQPLERWCDLRQLSTFVALENLLGHRDGYTLAANNYRVYQPTPGARFFWLPHGMDWLTPDQPDPLIPRPKGMVARAVTETSAGRALYRQAMGQALTNHFQPEALAKELARISRRLQPILRSTDPLQAQRQIEAATALLVHLTDRRSRFLEALAARQQPSATNPLRSSPNAAKLER